MFDKFEYKTVELSSIKLDVRNPRLVTRQPLNSETEIVEYLFQHESLADFMSKIAQEGRNIGAERPYLVPDGDNYIVIEGNTRIAAYKLITGSLEPPAKFAGKVPAVSPKLKNSLLTIESSIAPSRDDLLPIMANAHFGLGDKSKWGYLGSRKAVYDEWSSGKKVAQIAAAFGRRKGQIRDLILEYSLYLKSLSFEWSEEAREILEDPSVEFNPPVRFLQGQGHKEKVGLVLDRENLKIVYTTPEAAARLQHLLNKLVIHPTKGLGATASFDAVFADFKPPPKEPPKGGPDKTSPDDSDKNPAPKLKNGALFNYPVTLHNNLLIQMGKEAAKLNCNTYPAAGTFLLRSFLESILQHLIDEQGANPDGKMLSLETSLNLCTSKSVTLHGDDKKILAEFRKTHLDYVNLGAHGSIVPNATRLFAARDCLDQFVKRNI